MTGRLALEKENFGGLFVFLELCLLRYNELKEQCEFE